ncbi:hypothetical protein DRJ16_02885 [Candidatus Woesearchaeota archaeon]|nr:MAG: hypothetical protein DRJ16_02885 [Candidatus Woesearchaeota archaeon]
MRSENNLNEDEIRCLKQVGKNRDFVKYLEVTFEEITELLLQTSDVNDMIRLQGKLQSISLLLTFVKG